MKISNELLSSYAEGHVTNAERNEVRKYLTEHPDNLESLASMMDDDYELEPFGGQDSMPSGDIAMNDETPSEYPGPDSRDLKKHISAFSLSSALSGHSFFSTFAPSHRIFFGSNRFNKKEDYQSKKVSDPKMAVSSVNDADVKLTKSIEHRLATFSERIDDLLDSLME